MRLEVPLVSVVVRSMDRPTLDRALASIAAQDYPNLRIFVVAACGPRHRELPDRCGSHPLHVVRSERQLLRPEAANAGIDAAAGEEGWITLLDDDDEFLPGQVETLQQALRSHPDARLAYGQSLEVDENGVPLNVYGSLFLPWKQLDCGFFQLGACAFASSLVREGARFDERLDILEDLEFFVQCAQRTRFVFVAKPVSRYHIMVGDSGTGGGRNFDPIRIGRALRVIRGKWHDLASRLEQLPQARLEHAQEALKAGRISAALDLLQDVLRELPQDANALNLTGVALMRLGNSHEAEACFRRALRVVPGQAGIEQNLRLALAEQARAARPKRR